MLTRMITIILLIILLMPISGGAAEGVKVSVRKDIDVLPVAELATTQTTPDVIVLENEYLLIHVIPNRGRPLAKYVFRSTGRDMLHSRYQPLPYERPDGFYVEFGGYYLSLPWNIRDKQPYDLAYEITSRGPERGEVHLWGIDPSIHLRVDQWVVVRKGSSLVSVIMKLSNITGSPVRFELTDFVAMSPGGEMNPLSFIVLPTSRVTVGESVQEWMGKKGKAVRWPQPWKRWDGFQEMGSFTVKGKDFTYPFVGVVNPRTKEAFIKIWKPRELHSQVRVWSFGKTYEKIMGAGPYFMIEGKTEPKVLSPGKAYGGGVAFYALRGVEDIGAATGEIAASITTGQRTYRLSRDELVIRLVAASPMVLRDVKAQLTLTNEKSTTGVGRGTLPLISPDAPVTRTWAVPLNRLKIPPGSYLLRAILQRADGKKLIEVSTAVELKP